MSATIEREFAWRRRRTSVSRAAIAASAVHEARRSRGACPLRDGDDGAERLGARSLAAGLGDHAVLQFDQRFDGEHLAEQGSSPADAPALDEVFERVEHRDDADLWYQRLGVRGEFVERSRPLRASSATSITSRPCAIEAALESMTRTGMLSTALGRDSRGLMRGRERGREREHDDAVAAIIPSAFVGALEGAG